MTSTNLLLLLGGQVSDFRSVKEKVLPFEPLIPNDETIEAIKAARRGELVTVGAAENLLEKLPDDDHLDLVRLGSHSEIGL